MSRKYAIDANTLQKGDLSQVVKLPAGMDLEEWLAANTVDFYNELQILCRSMNSLCTEESCPLMAAGPKYEYRWADGDRVKVPVQCSAPFYTRAVMDWTRKLLEDETVFPTTLGTPFPKNFRKVISQILKRIFRIYAHIYHSHSTEISALGEQRHLNTSFKRFVLFVVEFELVQRKELDALGDLIKRLTVRE